MYIYLFVYLVYIFYKSRTSLYMLQQNLYNENKRYLRWCERNKKRIFNSIDFLPLILSIFLFLSNESFIVEVIYVSIMIIYIIGIYDEYHKNQDNQNKIKFNITSRIKRLYLTEFIIIGILFGILLLTKFSGIVLIILTLIIAFLYYFIYLINILNKPIEKLIYNHYYF